MQNNYFLMKKPVQPPIEMSTEDEFDSFKAYRDAAADHSPLHSVHEELNYLAQFGTLDELYLDIVTPPFQDYEEEIGKFSSFTSQNSPLISPNEEKSNAFPSASLEILRSCRSRISTVKRKRVCGASNEKEEKTSSPSELSINHIIKVSAANFIHSKLRTGNELYAISHPYANAFLGLSEENSRDVRLMQDLLLCAEKVSNHHYDSASKLLEECHKLSFNQMNKTQRLVYYFTEALIEKIERGKGKYTMKSDSPCDPSPTAPSSATTAFFEKLPFSQITQFAAIQSMVEHASDCRKVHVIDLELRCGIHQIVLMQSLAARTGCQPIEHFKITAIAIDQPNLVVEEAGVRLRALATSLNVDFSFHVMRLEDFVEFQLSSFDLDEDETVLVHAAHALEELVSKPKELDILMRAMRRIRPRAMIIIEAEGNVNSPKFVNRFVESLHFCGAYFDSLEDCLKNGAAERAFIESKILNPLIRNTVAAEGGERKHRIVGIDVWRAFLARFGMVEMELSELAITHANLILNGFECRDSCMLSFNGNSLIVSWKETPICSLSVWKF